MFNNLTTITTAFALLLCQWAWGDELFDVLAEKDRALFKQGFDHCDLALSASLMTEDLEFYHDKGGVNKGVDSFVKTMEQGLCKDGKNQIRRHLIDGSLQVFPMYDDGELYGAIQMGKHAFAPAGEPVTGQPARFMHLWLIKDGEWRISRVLSYDHH